MLRTTKEGLCSTSRVGHGDRLLLREDLSELPGEEPPAPEPFQQLVHGVLGAPVEGVLVAGEHEVAGAHRAQNEPLAGGVAVVAGGRLDAEAAHRLGAAHVQARPVPEAAGNRRGAGVHGQLGAGDRSMKFCNSAAARAAEGLGSAAVTMTARG